MNLKHALISTLILLIVLIGCSQRQGTQNNDGSNNDTPDTSIDSHTSEAETGNIARFGSGEELVKAFENAQRNTLRGPYRSGGPMIMEEMQMQAAPTASAKAADSVSSQKDYSETNIQVEGVDEADIIKTDGDYVYTIAQGNLVIAKAYPSDEAKILSTTEFHNFRPIELFIQGDRLIVFGSAEYNFEYPTPVKGPVEDEIGKPKREDATGSPAKEIAPYPYPRHAQTVAAKSYDISDKEHPKLLRTVDVEGDYLTSRKIGSDVYFVVNAYPHFYNEHPPCDEIVPLYRESTSDGQPKPEEMRPIVRCTDVWYIRPIQAQNFITIASISMAKDDKAVEKEVIVGSGQNVYASLDNLYIAQTLWPQYGVIMEGPVRQGKPQKDRENADQNIQKTVITKLGLDKGKITFRAAGRVKGNILNQFSMDEYASKFRIATTISGYANNRDESTNNVYVLDEDMAVVGNLEDLAPGESIYAVRFMGKRGYLVTFKHVDPLFVIDLSNPTDPKVLGKLKIPGYSDYLHPYDDTRLIGIGKDVDESIDAEKVHTEGAVYYTAIQGIKMAIFDVSDVEHPIELHKEIIGNRGTDSPVLQDHKAFLFDKDKHLMVLPITLAMRPGNTPPNQEGDFVFQGAYVYDVTLDEGFKLRGRVTQYVDDEEFKKSGSSFRGDRSIKRSLYIKDVLYTLSDTELQLNDLASLEKLKALEFKKGEGNGSCGYGGPCGVVY